MAFTAVVLGLFQVAPGGEYQFEEGSERPFKLAGIVFDAQAIYTHFGAEPRLENAAGGLLEVELRLGEDYYYRLAAYGWEAEEDFAGGGDVDLTGWTVGLGWDWFFGAFRDFAFDMGGGIGILRARADDESDSGFYVQWEAALRWKVAPHLGLRVSGFADWVNLHFNTDDTEDFLNLSVGAGVEVSF